MRLLAFLIILVCQFSSKAQVVYSFTNCAASGQNGPSQTQVNAAYGSTNSLNGLVTINSQGIQEFTISQTGYYRIEANGAEGGEGGSNLPGKGARMRGDFFLTSGTVLKIAVGQKPVGTSSGGGGGSFVVKSPYNSNASILVIAGGGGGGPGNCCGGQISGLDGSISSSGANSVGGGCTGGLGGSNGLGGTGNGPYSAGGGGGFFSDGGNSTTTNAGAGGSSFINGLVGGSGYNAQGGSGGFGGGGGAGHVGGWTGGSGGGGGGYSGGGGACGSSNWGSGGGGGSYNNGTNQSNTAGFNSGNGSVTITELYSVVISQDSAIQCFGDSAAILSASVTGGASPFTYLWNTGASTSSISGLPAGTYSVTVTDNNSASTNASYLVTQPTALVSAIDSQQNVVCVNDTNGFASVDVSGGTTPYTFLWSNGSTTQSTSTLGSGVYSVTVSDANGCEQTISDTILVLDSISPSVVSQNLTVYLDATGAASITAAQVDNGSSDNCSVDSLYLDQTGFDCSDTGVNVVTLTAVDPSGNSSSATADITVLDTISPSVISQNLTVYLDATGAASITAAQVDNGSSDNCSVDSLYLDQTGFDCSDTGVNVVTLTAVDPSGNSSSATADITVLDTISPSVISQNLTVYLDATGAASITAAQVDNGSSDNCSVDSLYLDQTGFDCSDTGVNVVTLTAVDPSGNSSSATADITVLDTISPSVVSQNLTVYLDAAGAASITAAQVDNGSSDNCSVDSLYLDQTDFDCSETGVNVVTLTAVDPSGNSSSVTADITVLDTISPSVISQNITVYLDAAGMVSITAGQADNGSSDNCSVDLSLSQSDFTCEHEGTNTVALLGVDPSGNTTIDSFTIEVMDTLFEVSAIQGTDSLPQGAVHSYYVDSIAGAVYQWSVVNGTLSANGANAEVTWSQDSLSGQISVIQTVEQGCLDSTSQVITLWLTGIDHLILSEHINLFPNPTRDKVNLSLNQGRLEQVEVRVYANDGRLVLTQSNLILNQSNHEIDLSKFATGQYTIVVSQAGKANQYKVILN